MKHNKIDIRFLKKAIIAYQNRLTGFELNLDSKAICLNRSSKVLENSIAKLNLLNPVALNDRIEIVRQRFSYYLAKNDYEDCVEQINLRSSTIYKLEKLYGEAFLQLMNSGISHRKFLKIAEELEAIQ